MQNMIKRLREKEDKLAKKEGGFTLVELIVVLVILAILAAILVPTLVGYINRANSEKDYSTAQTVRVAAQSVADETYAKTNTHSDVKSTDNSQINAGKTTLDDVNTLAGVDSKQVTAFDFKVDTNGQITGGTVTINNHTYTLKTDGNANGAMSWSAQ